MSRKTTGAAMSDCIRIFAPEAPPTDAASIRLFVAPDPVRPGMDRGQLKCASDYELNSPLRHAIAALRMDVSEQQPAESPGVAARVVDPRAVSELVLMAAWNTSAPTRTPSSVNSISAVIV